MSATLAIALIGAGHIGGSFALALKEAAADVRIVAFDTDTAQSDLLYARGGADAIAASATEAVRDADIVMLAVPLRSYRSLAAQIAPVLPPHAIVTDLGSVKHTMKALSAVLPATRLVPGHPIAGGERSGAAAASAELFRQRLCILTPDDETSAESASTIETLWHLTGADVLRMPVTVHDTIYAYVSHLPHLIAFVAAEGLFASGAKVDAGDETLQKFLRISRSNARMWTDVFMENREALLPALGTYIALLEHFVTELASGADDQAVDAQAVQARFVPRILASSLISNVSLYEQQSGMDLRPFGAGGMRDIVAPAAIDPEKEFEAMSHNAKATSAALQRIIPLFKQLESLIGAEDEPALFQLLTGMVAHAHALISPRQ